MRVLVEIRPIHDTYTLFLRQHFLAFENKIKEILAEIYGINNEDIGIILLPSSIAYSREMPSIAISITELDGHLESANYLNLVFLHKQLTELIISINIRAESLRRNPTLMIYRKD